MIVFDASALVGAALKVDSVPERALLRAEELDVFALSSAAEGAMIDREVETGLIARFWGYGIFRRPWGVPARHRRRGRDG